MGDKMTAETITIRGHGDDEIERTLEAVADFDN